MKKIIFVSLLIALASVAAFAKTENVSVRLGQTKIAAGGKVGIRFISVIEDSRCPMNARCIRAGNAKIKVEISVGRRPAKIYELNSNESPQSVTFGDYRFSLQDLKPQKGRPANWPKGPIRATISVESAR